MAKGENMSAPAEEGRVKVWDKIPVPTRVEAREVISKLYIRSTDFEMGGMQKMAAFDRLAAGYLAALLDKVEELEGGKADG